MPTNMHVSTYRCMRIAPFVIRLAAKITKLIFQLHVLRPVAALCLLSWSLHWSLYTLVLAIHWEPLIKQDDAFWGNMLSQHAWRAVVRAPDWNSQSFWLLKSDPLWLFGGWPRTAGDAMARITLHDLVWRLHCVQAPKVPFCTSHAHSCAHVNWSTQNM